MTPKLFSELGLSPELLKAIDKLGFEQASPIQAQTIPLLLQGKDLVGQSQTGSGKTIAFAAPAIEKVNPQKRETQVLILCPTRELAVQVSEEVHKLTTFKRGIHALPIYGGQSYERQLLGLRQGAHIVIGTPGRVMDHMQRGTMRLNTVKMVILDEADVMLNMGFREDIEFILKAVPTERQTVFFCATMPRAILDLIQTFAREPQSVRIQQTALTTPTIEQVYYEVMGRYKVELLTRLIDLHDFKFGIIFCNTKRMVDDLVDHLEAQGYSADRLHGDMSQQMRDRVMNRFRKSGLEFLVATDVAARGIDVDDVEVVFNYDLPYDVEDYVHRIGRTGRAGRSGMAISFVAGRELFQISSIERYSRQRIRRGRPPTAQEVMDARAGQFLDTIREVLQGKKFQPQDHLIEHLLEEGFSSTDIASALIHMLRGGNENPATAKPAPKEGGARPGPTTERRDRDERPDVRPEARPVRAPAAQALPAPIRPRKEIVITPRPLAPKPAAPKPAPTPKRAAEPVATTEARPSAPAATSPVPPPAPSVPAPAPVTAPVKPAPEKPIPEAVERLLRNADKRMAPTSDDAPVATPAPERPPKKVVPPQDPNARLHINIGSEMGVEASDVISAIMGETGLPAKVIGPVDLRERHLFVVVATEHANAITSRLNRATIKGRKVKVKLA